MLHRQGSRRPRPGTACIALALLVAFPATLPQSAAANHSTGWILADPEGDLRLPTGSGIGLAKDGADLRALKLERTSADTANVTISLANLATPYPELPSPTWQQVRYVLRFSTPEWKTTVDVTVADGDAPTAYVDVFIVNDYAAFWFGYPAEIAGSEVTFQLEGFFEGPWNGIWIESIAELCTNPCLSGVFTDRAPNVGTAPTFY